MYFLRPGVIKVNNTEFKLKLQSSITSVNITCRDAEERYEESQREVADYAAEVQRYRSQLEHLRAQMVETTKLKTRLVFIERHCVQIGLLSDYLDLCCD